MHSNCPWGWGPTFPGILAIKEMTEMKLTKWNEKETTPHHPAHQAKTSKGSSNTFTPVCYFSDYFSGGTIKLKSLQASAPDIDLKNNTILFTTIKEMLFIFPPHFIFHVDSKIWI